MGKILNVLALMKKYYKFTSSELRGMIISILVISFVISFKDWGPGNQVNLGIGLFNLFNAILIVSLTFLVRESAHRIGAFVVGFRAEYKMWTWGLLLSLVLAFVSQGKIWFLMPGGIIVHHLAGHRLGWFRYGLNYIALAAASVWAPIASLALVIFFKLINHFIQNPLIEKLILFNIAMTIWSMIPIPPMDGSRIFYGSRLFYAFSFSSIIAASLLLHFMDNVLFAALGAILIGIIGWLLYYIFLERFLWQGPSAKM